MRAVLPRLRSPAARFLRLGAWLGVAVLLGALAHAAGEGLGPEARGRLVRYVGIVVAAGLAIGAPHALVPDPHAAALQLANPSPRRLLRHQLTRWAPIPLLLTVPASVIALGGAVPRWGLAAEGAIGVLALGAYAYARTAVLGPRVLAWERAEAGRWYRTLRDRAPQARFLVPDPLVPGLLVTGEVFLIGGFIGIVGQAGAGIVASGAVLAGAGVLVARRLGAFDRAFWATHGVWADAFRQTAGPTEGRAPIGYGAVYWAPPAVRAPVWAGLVSLDRRFPLGRVAAALLAIVVVAGVAGEGVRTAALGLYVAAMNGSVVLTASDTLVPGPLTYRLGGAGRWALVRFLMNVRWLPPLVAALALLAWLTQTVGIEDIVVWSLVDLAIAALSAAFVTLVARARLRRAFA